MDKNKNTGNENTGNRNTGDWNTGNENTGNKNTGHCNTGHYNTGHCNTGNCNTGSHNIGSGNIGHCNIGDKNTGDCNTGYRNTGDCNTGELNTGNWNTGNRNTGDFNTGDFNTGFFCTKTPSPMFFDRPVDMTWDEAKALIPFVDRSISCEWVSTDEMTDEEKIKYPSHTTTGGFLRIQDTKIQDVFPKEWAKMDNETKQKFLSLPNFDAQKFFECTGVDVHQKKSTVTIKLADGTMIQIEGEVVA